MQTNKPLFVFDVESIGLHGEGFAVGWVLIKRDGELLREGTISCSPDEACGNSTDRRWVKRNVPDLIITHKGPRSMRTEFWVELAEAIQSYDALVFTECGWPVEANFLSACIKDNNERSGPYPIHDIASVMLAAGMDPLATYDRQQLELPKHNPLCDARQSARLLLEALNKLAQ